MTHIKSNSELNITKLVFLMETQYRQILKYIDPLIQKGYILKNPTDKYRSGYVYTLSDKGLEYHNELCNIIVEEDQVLKKIERLIDQ